MLFHREDTYDSQPAKNLLQRLNDRVFPYEIEFGGVRLVIEKDVFCPTYTKTSAIMLECLKASDLTPRMRVLDVFSGSGVFAIYCAKAGCNSVAIDISPAATTCAEKNAALNSLVEKVDVRCANGFEGLKSGELFDLVIACPPLLPGVAEGVLEAALVDEELGSTMSFVGGLRDVLTSDGRALLFLSDVFARVGHNIDQIAGQNGLAVRVAIERDVGYETYSVVELSHA